MTRRILTVALRIAILAALTASAALFVEYRSTGTAFCGASGGCAEIRASAFSSIAGIGLPTYGMGVFLGLAALSLIAHESGPRLVLRLAASVVGLGALALIGIQLFWLGAVCAWCMVVDVSAVAAAALAWAQARLEPDPEPTGLRMLWALAGVVAVAAPLLWRGASSSVALPAGVARTMTPGKVNIVTFTDFECPFCRDFHPVIDEVHELHPGSIVVTRLMSPLASHPGAEPAARAYLCAPPKAKDAVAHQLYRASPGALDDDGTTELVSDLGLDAAAFRACLGDPQTAQRLAADMALFEEAGLRGLPSTYVNDQLVEGADVPAFLTAIDRQLDGRAGPSLMWMFVVLGLAGTAACAAGLLDALRARGRSATGGP